MARVALTGEVLDDDAPTPTTASAPPPSAPPVPAQPEMPRRRFTMLVDDVDDRRARELTDVVVRLAGIRPTKGMRADVVRVLVEIASGDERLQRKVAKMLVNRLT